MNDVLFSSRTDLWSTPQWLFDDLNREFHFTLDACAFPSNAKCPNFFSPEINGLCQDWMGVVWCNPPYGRYIGEWIKKASLSPCTVVMLLPARTDTAWFHDYIYGRAEIRFLRGRLRFGDARNCAPFPSMIVVFRNDLKEGIK